MHGRRKNLLIALVGCLALALGGLLLMGFGGSQSVGDVGFFTLTGAGGTGLVLLVMLVLDATRSTPSR